MSSSSDIVEALNKARFNEAVIISISLPSGDSDSNANSDCNDFLANLQQEVVLVATLDKENGGIKWENDLEYKQSQSCITADGIYLDAGIVRHLRTKKWVMPMLNDHRRNNLYETAISISCQRVIQQLLLLNPESESESQSQSEGNSHQDCVFRCLDIGSGTGLLAMMTATFAQKHITHDLQTTLQKKDTINTMKAVETNNFIKVEITSVEMATAMARLANLTIHSNHLQNTIQIKEGHSCELTFFPHSPSSKKANMCTSELLESGLLGEGIIPAMRDAWQRHLTPDAIVVPKRARVYAQVLEGQNCIGSYRGPSAVPSMLTDDANDDDRKIRLSTSPDDDSQVLLGGSYHHSSGIIVPVHIEALFSCDTRSATNTTTHRSPDDTSHHNQGINSNNNDFQYQYPSQDDSNITHDSEWDIPKPLTDPCLVLEFDFTTLHTIPPHSGRSFQKTITPIASGIAHGVLFWWELDLHDDLTYSTAPGSSPWQDHWQQCIFVFGCNHSDCPKLEKGVPVTLISSHDDYRISFEIETILNEEKGTNTNHNGMNKVDDIDYAKNKKRPRIDNESQPDIPTPAILPVANQHISHERALQLNNIERIQTIYKAVNSAIQIRGMEATILDLSDFCLCSLLAASTGASRVISLESSSGNLPLLSATVAQIGNKFPRKSDPENILQDGDNTGDNDNNNMFLILNAHADQLTVDNIGGRQVDIVVAEPYYEILEGWHIEEALNYFYLIRSLKKKNIIKNDAISIPSYALIKGCIIEFDPVVLQAYRPLSKSKAGGNIEVCGFCHHDVDQYYQESRKFESTMSVWQYKWKKLTNCTEIAKIDYETMCITNDVKQNMKFVRGGTCHALLLWVEYFLSCNKIDNNTSHDGSMRIQTHLTKITTGDRFHKQTIKWLDSEIEINQMGYDEKIISITSKFGDFSTLESHVIDVVIEDAK